MEINMNKFINYFAGAAILLVVLFNGAAFGQTENTKMVGIDPAKNTVQLPNTTDNPLPVKVVGSGSARKPFQARVFVTPAGTGFSSGTLAIPDGKRLVIENVSVVGRVPEGMKLEVNFFTHMDNDGDGVGGIEDIVFHRIPMTDQGVFDGTTLSAFNQKMLVFADSKIGDASYAVVAQARLNGMPPANSFVQVQFTISGYLEDLPTNQ
jgi:hypothetical protein